MSKERHWAAVQVVLFVSGAGVLGLLAIYFVLVANYAAAVVSGVMMVAGAVKAGSCYRRYSRPEDCN